jgi:hypothetical protein
VEVVTEALGLKNQDWWQHASIRDFFKDPGPADPLFISDLLPPIDQ